MAVVKLANGEEIGDRRTNGARLKLAVGDWLKIILFLITIVWGYAILTATVHNNSTAIAQQDKTIMEADKRSIVNENSIIALKDDVKEIKCDVKTILKLVK